MNKDERINEELNKVAEDLETLFGEKSFDAKRWDEYQKPIMGEILEENSNTLAILPTATGKSILYQYFALFKHEAGIVIVIEPLQSIINDQINAFNKLTTKISSKLSAGSITEYLNKPDEIPENIAIVFSNPEQLFSYSNQIADLVKNKRIAIQMVVIDELHTMFEWGSSFRSEFLFIPDFVSIIKNANKELNRDFKVLSLTATLTKTEMDLCRIFLNADSKKNSDSTMELASEKKVDFVKADKMPDTYDPLIEILDGSCLISGYKLIEGIAFFKEKKDIANFIKYLYLSTESRTDFKIDKSEDSIYVCKTAFATARKQGSMFRGKRHLIEFTGDLNSEAKDHLLEQIITLANVYVLATKALAMGVDLQSITDIQIIGIPESWNCFLQEIGRVRTEGGTYRAFYWSKDALDMLKKLVLSERRNPICIYDPFVNVMERIKAWDYLCLWEWYLDSINSNGGNLEKAPDGVDISLEELLRKRPEDIRNKLKRIITADPQIKEKDIEEYNFDFIFRPKFVIGDLKQQPLIYINTSQALMSFGNYYSGIFNGGRAKIKRDDITWILKVNTSLSFIDFMVFNAICTCSIYGIEAEENRILKLLLGLGSDKQDLLDNKYRDLLKYVKRSLERIKTTKIERYIITALGKSSKKPVGLYDNGTFPIFNAFPELQHQVGVVETAKVRYLFDSIRGKGKNLTAVNIIAIFYTLFGIERHKQIYGITADNNGNRINKSGNVVFALPYRNAAIEGALKEWFDHQKHRNTKNKSQEYNWNTINQSQEYGRLIKKMQKVSVLEQYPATDPSDNELIKQKYEEIIKKADAKMKPKSESPQKNRSEKQKEKFARRWEKWNNGKKEKWDKDKKEKLILYVKKKGA